MIFLLIWFIKEIIITKIYVIIVCNIIRTQLYEINLIINNYKIS